MSKAFDLEAQRDAALAGLTGPIPYRRFLGIEFERRGDELTSVMRYDERLIGNPFLPALHGGAIGAFLEFTAIVELGWSQILEEMDAGGERAARINAGQFPPRPKPVDITIDYLRSGKPADTFARALILRKGRRIANIRVEAWQEARSKPIAAAHGHFLLPQPKAE